MSAALAQLEADAVKASDRWDNPAAVIQSYAVHAATLYRAEPWQRAALAQGGGTPVIREFSLAPGDARHTVEVGILLAQAAGQDPGQVLRSLADGYRIPVP